MATKYEPAPGEVMKVIEMVLRKYQPALHEYGVTVSAVFAIAEDKDESPVPAIKKNGLVVAAKIQVSSLSDRARGQCDAKMTICQMSWDRMGESTRVALIDHELEHLELNPDKEGTMTDDLARPRLKLRPHDWELTGFASVVGRHGESSVESREIVKFRSELGEQLGFWPK